MKKKFILQKWPATPIIALLFLLFSSTAFSTMGITVNGQANGAVIIQGNSIQWNITGLANGATVLNNIWMDLNGNNIVDPASDLLFITFNQTDGVPGNDGPGDDDGLVNGAIQTTMNGISLAEGAYIFKSKSGTDSAQSTFSVTPMLSPTFYVNGYVTQGGAGRQNIAVSVRTEPTGNEYFAITDVNGAYSITSNIVSGTFSSVRVPQESFNSSLNGFIVSPQRVDTVLSSSIFNINFTVMPGKIVTGLVTDTLGNPVQDLAVTIYPKNGGNGFDGRTAANGTYVITVDTGYYTVRFGRDDEPKGFIKTYFNQKYVGWLSDSIHITSATDTLKNINAVLRRGGVIMGTFKNNGVSASGGISVHAYNSGGINPLYEVWHDSQQEYYYLIVPPGTYTIQFNTQNGGNQVYFNQTWLWPGNAVNLNSLTDTTRNINVEFSTVHKKYVFNGSGDWSTISNWKNNMMPPPELPSGDTIVVNHSVGGFCRLNTPMHILPGGIMIIVTGKNLIIPGELKLQ